MLTFVLITLLEYGVLPMCMYAAQRTHAHMHASRRDGPVNPESSKSPFASIPVGQVPPKRVEASLPAVCGMISPLG